MSFQGTENTEFLLDNKRQQISHEATNLRYDPFENGEDIEGHLCQTLGNMELTGEEWEEIKERVMSVREETNRLVGNHQRIGLGCLLLGLFVLVVPLTLRFSLAGSEERDPLGTTLSVSIFSFLGCCGSFYTGLRIRDGAEEIQQNNHVNYIVQDWIIQKNAQSLNP